MGETNIRLRNVIDFKLKGENRVLMSSLHVWGKEWDKMEPAAINQEICSSYFLI